MSSPPQPPSQPWWTTLYILDSHFPLVFYIYETINRLYLSPIMGIANAVGWLVFAASFSYHLCIQTGYCAFDESDLVAQQIDNILAFGAMPVAVFLITDNGYKRLRHQRNLFVNQMLFMLTFGATIALVLTGLNAQSNAIDPPRALAIVVMNLAVMFLKLILADGSQLSLRKRFSQPRVIVAILALIIAVVCFELNVGADDWITHATWHWMIFLALSLLIPQPDDKR